MSTKANNLTFNCTRNPTPIYVFGFVLFFLFFFASSSSSSSLPSSSLWLSEMELPLTFKDSSRKVIIELLPAVCRQEIGKWHMGPGTK